MEGLTKKGDWVGGLCSNSGARSGGLDLEPRGDGKKWTDCIGLRLDWM